VFINGATIFDVPGESQKDYKLSIYALKAANVKFSIYFKNPLTHEFIFYKAVIIVLFRISSLTQLTHKNKSL
jgi:hypothetical protein